MFRNLPKTATFKSFSKHISSIITSNNRLSNQPKKFVRKYSLQSESSKQILIYEGLFSQSLRLLKQVSVGSSIICIFGLPIALTTNTGIPLLGLIAIGGSALFTSLSSTLFLSVITYPYVLKLYEIPTFNGDDRKFIAERLRLTGFSYKTEFNLSQVVKVTGTAHPFASFKVGNTYFYVFGNSISDPTLRSVFDK